MVLQTYSDKQKEEKEVTKQDHQKWSVRLAANREIGSCVPMLMAVSCLSPVRIQIFMSALDRLEMVSGTPYRTTRHINTLKQNWKVQYRYKVKFSSMHKTKMYDTYNHEVRTIMFFSRLWLAISACSYLLKFILNGCSTKKSEILKERSVYFTFTNIMYHYWPFLYKWFHTWKYISSYQIFFLVNCLSI